MVAIQEQSFIFDAYKALNIQTVAYLDTILDYPTVEWIIQDISIPLLINSEQNPIILIRPATLDPGECVNIDIKIREALQQKSGPAQATI